jgi:hypothetical protein
MHSLGDMAADLNRSTVYLSGLQKRIELPIFEGAAYLLRPTMGGELLSCHIT